MRRRRPAATTARCPQTRCRWCLDSSGKRPRRKNRIRGKTAERGAGPALSARCPPVCAARLFLSRPGKPAERPFVKKITENIREFQNNTIYLKIFVFSAGGQALRSEEISGDFPSAEIPALRRKFGVKVKITKKLPAFLKTFTKPTIDIFLTVPYNEIVK